MTESHEFTVIKVRGKNYNNDFQFKDVFTQHALQYKDQENM